jgi:thiamine kinase-like enzyme
MVLDFEQRNIAKWMRIKDHTVEFKYNSPTYFDYLIRNYNIIYSRNILTPRLTAVDKDNCTAEFEKIHGTNNIDPYNQNIFDIIENYHSAGTVEDKIDYHWLDLRLPVKFVNRDILTSTTNCFIHSDPSRVNFIHNERGIYVIDIEDSVMGPREFDYAKIFFDQYSPRDFKLYDKFLNDANIKNEELFLVCAQWQTIFADYFIQHFDRPISTQLERNAKFINQKLKDFGLPTQEFYRSN